MPVIATGSVSIASVTDGEQGYTWIMYADNNVGSGISDKPEGKPYVGIAYNKLTPIPSTHPADYTWSKIRGDDGNGIISAVTEYQMSDSGTVTPTGEWSKDPVRPEAGKFVWTRTTTHYSDGKSTVAYSVTYSATAEGIDGATVITSPTAPALPKPNQLWNDSSTTPGTLKIWSEEQQQWIVYLFTARNIQAHTIGAEQIAANSITGNEIKANTITGDKIVAGSITADSLSADAINAAKIVAEGLSTTDATIGKTLTIGNNGSITTTFSHESSFIGWDNTVKYKADGELNVSDGGFTIDAKVTGIGGANNGYVNAPEGKVVPVSYDLRSQLSDSTIYIGAKNGRGYVNGATTPTAIANNAVSINPWGISLYATNYNVMTSLSTTGVLTPELSTVGFKDKKGSVVTDNISVADTAATKTLGVSGDADISGNLHVNGFIRGETNILTKGGVGATKAITSDDTIKAKGDITSYGWSNANSGFKTGTLEIENNYIRNNKDADPLWLEGYSGGKGSAVVIQDMSFRGRNAFFSAIKLGVDTLSGNRAYPGVYIQGAYNRPIGSNGKPLLVTSDGLIGVSSSTEREKEDIETADKHTLDLGHKLLTVRTTSWKYKIDKLLRKDYEEQKLTKDYVAEAPTDYGMIAEELASVGLEEFVQRNDKTNEINGIDYEKLTVPLISLTKELYKKNAENELKMLNIEERLNKLEGDK
jgi:hypothetical protein